MYSAAETMNPAAHNAAADKNTGSRSRKRKDRDLKKGKPNGSSKKRFQPSTNNEVVAEVNLNKGGDNNGGSGSIVVTDSYLSDSRLSDSSFFALNYALSVIVLCCLLALHIVG